MKEVYTSASDAGRDLGIEAKVLRFFMQKGIVKSCTIIPDSKGKKKKYIIYTRQLCKELGIPFVGKERSEENGNNPDSIN